MAAEKYLHKKPGPLLVGSSLTIYQGKNGGRVALWMGITDLGSVE